MRYSGNILVEDATGCRFELYEYRERRLILSIRRYMLDTGEIAQRINKNTFRIASTGELMVRVTGDSDFRLAGKPESVQPL
jgi:hypothetical protein